MAKSQDTGAPQTSTAQSEPTKPDRGRTFSVIKGQVGPWNAANGDVFDETEFKRLNPIPKTKEADDQIDPEGYHATLINRLLHLKVIAHAPDAKATNTPLGPESSPGKPVKNAQIEAAIKEHDATQQNRAALKAGDMEQAKQQTGTHFEAPK
jgi:hypothetical protein